MEARLDLARKIAELPILNKAQLLPIWRENFNKEPPPKLRKELMVPILAYRIQEREFGGLSHTARRKLREIAQTLAGERPQPQRTAASPETGTRLVRVWHGETHEVMVTDKGLIYRGKQFSSLSKIAHAITGTQWSGPAFFGTKEKKAK